MIVFSIGKWCVFVMQISYAIFKLVTEAWAQLLNCQLEIESMAEGSNSAQKRVFKDPTLLFFMHLHTCADELLYRHNITLIVIWLYIGMLCMALGLLLIYFIYFDTNSMCNILL